MVIGRACVSQKLPGRVERPFGVLRRSVQPLHPLAKISKLQQLLVAKQASELGRPAHDARCRRRAGW